MICRHCGKEIPESSVFCPFCGKKIESHLRAEDAYAEKEAAEREYKEYIEQEYEEPIKKPKRKRRRGKALLSILAAIIFVVLAFIIVMVVAKPFLGEEPWDGSKDQTEQTEEAEENSGPIKNMYVSAEEGLIMRKDQDQDSDAVHILNYGQEVEVQKINESWAYVTADGVTGWVSTEYLTDDKIEVTTAEKSPESEEDKGKLVEPATRIKSGAHGVVNAEGGLNLRCGPGKDYNILLVVPDKTEVIEEGRDGDWIFIKYSGEYGWVNTEYITPVNAD